MKKVNQGAGESKEQILITDFWDTVYRPYVEKNLRHSTFRSYVRLYENQLKPHFLRGRFTFPSYEPKHGSRLLTELAKMHGQRSLQHVRSLASGIFRHAINLGDYGIKVSPWHEVKILGKVRRPGNTEHYSLEEAEDLISALVDHVDAQLMLSLGFFLGLRPSEIRGLMWRDVEEDFIHLRRGVVLTRVDELKAEASVRSLPLIQPVRGLLTLWRRMSGNPIDGFVFTNRNGKPIDLQKFAYRVILPTLEEKRRELRAMGLEAEAERLRWKSFYAARRGGSAEITNRTRDPLAAAQLLGHKTIAVTMEHYIKHDRSVLLAGMKLLEAAAMKRDQLKQEAV